jgi:glyoxylase-like metal-dependent hydrolase (beta-lactamase superfamily II)
MSEQKKTITPAELKKRLDAGTVEFIFDLRAEDEFAGWRIEGRTSVDTMNIPQEDFVGEEEGHLAKFPKDREIVTVCAHGDSAQYSADLLGKHGFKAVGLEGGMDSWSQLYETRTVSESPLIYQIYRVAKGCISHVVISDGEAVVIDAIRHIEHITKIIDDQKATVVAVIDTHLQADHISGGPELVEKYGAPYYISAVDARGAAYTHIHPIHGMEVKVGSCTLQAVHTPGHTPGSTAWLLNGAYLFTGDTVMGTSEGRPDLGGMVDQWARFLWYTLFTKMAWLPDDVTVLPTHAASIREQGEDGVVKFALSRARAEHDAFQIRDKGKFIAHIKSTLPENPERYAEIRKVNLGKVDPDEKKRTELEIGKNLCGMSDK